MNTDLHFAENPDDPLCGRVAIRTLCGEYFQNATNWNVERVTCQRCLEVMEDRVAGIERVTRIHDEYAESMFWENDVPYNPHNRPKTPSPFLNEEIKKAYEAAYKSHVK